MITLEVDPDSAQLPLVGAEVPRRAAARPRALLISSTVVVIVLLAPLAFLLVEATHAGLSGVLRLIFRSLTFELFWNTVRLTVVVTALCAVIGIAAAWCIERTDLPGRSIWAVLVVVPFAIPDFIVSFGWSSLSTWVEGFRGAVLVMTLAIYPLVYLPVAASFRGADPGQEEIARSLGAGRVSIFLRVTLGQARMAILGGSLLVALVILAEYGAFEILGYQTFTTEVFTEFGALQFPTACALSFVLVLVSLVVLFGETASRGKHNLARTGSGTQRVLPRQRLGKATLPVLGVFTVFSLASLGVPIGSSIYWIFRGGAHSLVGVSLVSAALHTAAYGAVAAGLATLMALPLALLAVRHSGRVRAMLERSTFVVLAMPGVVIALAISYFSENDANGLFYQSAPLLILAYAILFFPLALVGVRASVAQAPVRLEEVAASLGVDRLRVLLRVTLPLVLPGLGAAFCLVFLSAVTELTATLILVPNGVQTLSTQFWAYQQNLSYGQAAPFALTIIAIAAVPSYVLGRFFDRLPARGELAVRSLEVVGVYKSYGPQAVLKGLDLAVPAGAFTSILGPSGSGKTTLLRVIAGFERADSGVVRLAGELVDDGHQFVPSNRRKIGYVPQEGSLFPHLSVRQNVAFGLARGERRGAKVQELLAMVGLEGFGARYPHQLSGGQQQRVALARALAIDPALVLLDEPFSSLDANLRASVRADVRRVLRDAGATAVLVTHDQEEALSLADEVAVIREGRIGQVDSPQGLYRHPGSPELARSLGETNFMDGVARRGAAETAFGVLPLENADHSEGTPLVVLVRPEQVELADNDTPGALAGHVVDCEFYGHDAVVRVRLDKEPTQTVVARTTRATESLTPGTAVALCARGTVVGWPRESRAEAFASKSEEQARD